MRLDKWLWAARFYKTRRLAVDEINRGRVKVNGITVRPARMLSIGDKLSINKAQTFFEVTVLALIENRGSAKIAATMYEESEESILKREKEREIRKLSHIVMVKNPSSREKKRLRDIKKGTIEI